MLRTATSRWTLASSLALALALTTPGLAQETGPGSAPTAGAAALAAPADQPAGQDPLAALDEEPAQVQALSDTHKFIPGVEGKDPFKPLVVKPLPPKTTEVVATAPVVIIPGPEKPPPPLQLFVSGICGNESERLAMIIFENRPFVVHKEMNVDGKFKVVDVLADRLVIYSNREQMRRTFPIGGGKE
ncbi:MAG: hypothetical protein GX442_08390 [Candidatus Riflebacteria bacterium]|nr:hypothetical protein [Candidatus Riflebacteria bacterium]